MRHFFTLFFLLGTLFAQQQIQFTNFPAHLQLYPRDAQDSAVVAITGSVVQSGYAQIQLDVYQNQQVWKSFQKNLVYQNGTASFAFYPKIYAGLYEYDFKVYLDDQLVAQEDSIVCGDVFLINGQSNSHPGATSYNFKSEFCRSFGRHTNYDDYDPADTTWGLSTPEGWCNCAYAVGVWGLRIQELILNKYQMPTCIINGGSGGSTISYNLPDSTDHMNLTTTYGRLLYRATKAKVADHVKAMLWHQGESDSYPDPANLYLGRFDTLRTAWRQDFSPLTKIYVFQLHPGTCGGTDQHHLREVQRSFKKYYPEVSVMSTCGLVGHDGCHYSDDGYLEMAEWIFRLIERDFYNATDTLNIDAPDILSVYYQNSQKNSIVIEYDQPVIWPNDTLGHSMKDYFYLDDNFGFVKNGYTTNGGYTLILELTTSVNAQQLTYLPNATYNRLPTAAYEGPWIRNQRGVGALSFYHVPIEAQPSVIFNELLPESKEIIKGYPNPFNARIKIVLRLKNRQQVRLAVFNSLGQKVRTLLENRWVNGKQSVVWDGKDEQGNALPSGTYFVRLDAKGKTLTQKVSLVR